MILELLVQRSVVGAEELAEEIADAVEAGMGGATRYKTGIALIPRQGGKKAALDALCKNCETVALCLVDGCRRTEAAVAALEVPAASLKMLRETLCRVQSAHGVWPVHPRQDMERVQVLIDQIDKHRPLGPDGKHGDRHTATCGCED